MSFEVTTHPYCNESVLQCLVFSVQSHYTYSIFPLIVRWDSGLFFFSFSVCVFMCALAQLGSVFSLHQGFLLF